MRARKAFRKITSVIKKPEMRILPGQLAFFLVLSLIPLIALVGSIASSFGLSLETLKEAIESSVPSGVVNLLLPTSSRSGIDFNVAVFFVAAFILASNGTYSMIVTSNEIYHISSSSELKRRIKAIFMTFILVFLFLFLMIVPAFGDLLVEFIQEGIYDKNITHILQILYGLLKYPISIFLLYYNIKLLYTLAPDKKLNEKNIIPGALFTTIMWLLSSKIYAFYIDYFSRYDIFYGSMSNLLVLLLWVYILSYIFTLGMGFNATREEKEEVKQIEEEKVE